MSEEKIVLKAMFVENFMNSELLAGVMKKQLPVKLSYFLAVILDKMDKETKIYFEKKKEVAEKYAEKEVDGRMKTNEAGAVMFSNESIAAAEADFIELANVDIDLGVNKFDIDLDKLPDLSVEEMLLLKPLFKDIEI